ncbi:MAG: hypothetical protein U0232_07350 [Thermomicrobiales bacterium]
MVLGSGRVSGALLVIAGLVFGLGGGAWLLVSGASTAGKVLGLVFLLIIVLPMILGVSSCSSGGSPRRGTTPRFRSSGWC